MPRKRQVGPDDEESSAPQHGCKRPKKAPAAVDRFTVLPKDVHFEVGLIFSLTLAGMRAIFLKIFGHLEPLDLLHLAHVTKGLRGALFDKASVAVWKAAWVNVTDLPRPPEGTSEPTWVSLIYEARCCVRSVLLYRYYSLTLCHSTARNTFGFQTLVFVFEYVTPAPKHSVVPLYNSLYAHISTCLQPEGSPRYLPWPYAGRSHYFSSNCLHDTPGVR